MAGSPLAVAGTPGKLPSWVNLVLRQGLVGFSCIFQRDPMTRALENRLELACHPTLVESYGHSERNTEANDMLEIERWEGERDQKRWAFTRRKARVTDYPMSPGESW